MVLRMRAFGMGRLELFVLKKCSVERDASPGSIIWVAHGTTVLRCALEQLRNVTHTLKYVSNLDWDHQTPSEILRKAKNSQRYQNLVPEVENRDDCDDLQDEDPDVDASLLNPRRLHMGIARYRACGKQAPYDGSSDLSCLQSRMPQAQAVSDQDLETMNWTQLGSLKLYWLSYLYCLYWLNCVNRLIACLDWLPSLA